MNTIKEPLPPRQRMFEAIHRGNVHELHAALAAGANINEMDEEGWRPLHLAIVSLAPFAIDKNWRGRGTMLVRNPGILSILQALIASGADLEARSNSGLAPLHLAASRGLVEFARSLIDAGADIQARAADGRVPRDYALERGQDAMVALLGEAQHEQATAAATGSRRAARL